MLDDKELGSRISADEGTHSYTFLSGAPVTRDGHLWVLLEPGFVPPQQLEGKTFISTIDLDKLLVQ